MEAGRSMTKTRTLKMRITSFEALGFCAHCKDRLHPNDEEVRPVLDGGGVIVGYAHAGYCAHQWDLKREKEESTR